MGHVVDQLLAPDTFPKVVDETSAAIKAEVQKRGLGIRTVFKLAVGAKPELVEAAMRKLLPDFAVALEPYYQQAQDDGKSLQQVVASNQKTVANDLLAVTDEKAKAVESRAIKGAYDKLRGKAEGEVSAALPAIIPVLEKYL